MSDELLRDAYRKILQRRGELGTRMSVDDDDIIALVERRGSEEERLIVLDRVMANEQSRRDFELVRAVAGSARSRQRSSGRRLMPISRSEWALAATVVLSIGLGSVWLTRRTSSNDTVRGGVRAAVSLLAPADGDTTATLKFTWHRVAEARSYAFELLDADGTPVATRITSDTSLAINGAIGVVPGASYRWWVIATLRDESTVAAVPRRLTLRRTP